jgi:hypothetical protein
MKSANDTLPIGELNNSGHDKHDEDPLTVFYLSTEQNRLDVDHTVTDNSTRGSSDRFWLS